MSFEERPRGNAVPRREAAANGGAMAAILAAGIGAFAIGLVVILSEAGLFAAPVLYRPSGGLSGRTTIAVVVWLVTWLIAHRLWRDRTVSQRHVFAVSLALIALGLVATFPPVWGVFE